MTKKPKKLKARSLPASPPIKPQDTQKRLKVSPDEIRAMNEFPEYFGEETQGGRMPNPEADDNSLTSIQEWGFDLEADNEHPKEINPQAQVDKAEKARRRKRE